MKVLMFGWEFPPQNKGGLGVACKGIVDGLLDNGANVHLVLPSIDVKSEHCNLNIVDPNKGKSASLLKKTKIFSTLLAYGNESSYEQYVSELNSKGKLEVTETKERKLYGENLFAEVHRYADLAPEVADNHEYDVIHAHDWMTYPAAIAAKKTSDKPMIAHVHATEMDRTGGNPNPTVFNIEKLGMQYADKIIAVSDFTKQKIIEHYHIDPDKIAVVHNAIAKDLAKVEHIKFEKYKKTVLFLGRMTMQKGPDYFLQAAAKVLEFEDNVKFIMAGDGDMMQYVINETIKLGIAEHVVFTGFLRGADIDKAYKDADLYVMPSISEPFGLTALEAVRNGTPVLLSKQSGVSEVLKNALKVNFWDTDEIANKMIAVLREDSLQETLSSHSTHDLKQMCWNKQASKIKDVYHDLVNPVLA